MKCRRRHAPNVVAGRARRKRRHHVDRTSRASPARRHRDDDHDSRGCRIPAVDRILVVSLDNLGDLVFTSALTPLLRAHFPAAKITLWCKCYTAPIGPLLPGVSDIEAAEPFWDSAPGGGNGAMLPFVQSVLRLRRRHFDLAILAAAPWRTAAATAATGAARRIGLARRKSERWLTDPLTMEDVEQPVLAEMSRLLEPLGITPPSPLRYALDPAPLHGRRERLRPLLGPSVAALHPFASKRNRCVALAEWIGVAEGLDERGFDPLWVGSAAELREVRATADGRWRYVDQLGDGGLADTAAALSLARLFAGHDSGPLHVAGAFGVPVLGVFTPGEPGRTFPQGVGASRMIVRPSPAGLTARDILAALDPLL